MALHRQSSFAGSVMIPALFLDRDGVINGLIGNRPPWTPNEVRLLPGVSEALAQVPLDIPIVIITNQPDAKRGKASQEDLFRVMRRIVTALPITSAYACWHDEADRCWCRKPSPGMIYLACAQHNISPQCSVLVGDRSSDIEAGKLAGCKTVAVGESLPISAVEADHSCCDLLAAMPWILEELDHGRSRLADCDLR